MNETPIKTLLIQGLLLVIVFFTTTFSGAEWISAKYVFFRDSWMTWKDFRFALNFSLPFLLILTVHEFGHYFVARYHKVKVTLPYYLPLWFGFFPALGLGSLMLPSIGTAGAVIRIRERLTSKIKFFDIGIAGPLAGFVVALGVLYYGFTHLPPKEYIYDIHPEYEYFGEDYAAYVYDQDTMVLKKDLEKYGREIPALYPDTLKLTKDRPMIALGSNLLMEFFGNYVAKDPSLVPNQFEMYHYPWIFAGFLALFFTALNLLPIGQLDGGHILYGLLGANRHSIVSKTLFYILIFYSGLGILPLNAPVQDLMWGSFLYMGFLYVSAFKLYPKPINRLTFAVVVFSIHFLLEWIFPDLRGYSGWLLFVLILGRFIGVEHPPTVADAPLDPRRQLLGWLALAVFILSFSPRPFIITGP